MKQGLKSSLVLTTTLVLVANCKSRSEKPPRKKQPATKARVDQRPRPPEPRPAKPRTPQGARPRAEGPLSKKQRDIFWGSPSERAPRKRAREGHYWVGNEWELYLYRDHLKNLGGGYVGVGSDQAYLFIGWMRPSFSWLVDYDEEVVDLQWVHHAFFRKAETPEAFVHFWSTRSKKQAVKIITEVYQQHPRLKAFLRVYRRAQPFVSPRLRRVRRAMSQRKIPCFLTDPAMYRYVAKSIEDGRVRPMVADLRGPKGLVGVGESARKLGVPIRAFYLSNAEEYWKRFPKQYIANVFALNYDEKSLILRTRTRSREQSTYNYHVQPAENFKAWLRSPAGYRVTRIKARQLKKVKNAGLFLADIEPPAPRKPRPRR